MKPLQRPMHISKSSTAFFRYVSLLFFISCLLLIFNVAHSQGEVEPWGNITGIRTNGQLIPFETSLSLVENNWSSIKSTGQEKQRPKYMRDGSKQIINTKIDSVNFIETIEDSKNGSADVSIAISSNTALKTQNVFFIISLPDTDYTSAVTGLNKKDAPRRYIELKGPEDFTTRISEISFISTSNNLKLTFDKPTSVTIKKNPLSNNNAAEVYISLLDSNTEAGTTAIKKFTIKAGGYIDNRSITFKLNTSKEGKAFDGFGGNFRLQNPKADPQVIDYCLQNLRVAWGRVEFPWWFWQPDENTDPVAAAKDGKLNLHVQQSMEMAARLGKMGIPIIISGWFHPQ